MNFVLGFGLGYFGHQAITSFLKKEVVSAIVYTLIATGCLIGLFAF